MPNITGMDLLKIAAANPDATVPPEGLELLTGKRQGKNKYNAVKVDFDGMRFDSKAEMRRYGELRYMELAGQISNLEVQPVFKLHAGVKYRADFRYQENGKTVCEDVKGVETPAFRIKWKQAQELYPDVTWRLLKK
jgi:hypothetical protein